MSGGAMVGARGPTACSPSQPPLAPTIAATAAMFYNAAAFNQPVVFDTARVTYMWCKRRGPQRESAATDALRRARHRPALASAAGREV